MKLTSKVRMLILSNVGIFRILLGLIQIGILQLKFNISLIAPFFRGNKRTVNGFSLWKKGNLKYVDLVRGPKENEFLAEVNYGYEIIAYNGRKLKIKPRKKTNKILNNVVEFESSYYTLTNNFIIKFDERLNELGCKWLDVYGEHIYSNNGCLYLFAQEFKGKSRNLYTLDSEMNMHLLSQIPVSSIIKLSDGFIAGSNIYNSEGVMVLNFNYLNDNKYSFKMNSASSKFLINEKCSAENGCSIEIVTLPYSLTQKVFVTNPSVQKKKLLLSPNEKYYAYASISAFQNYDLWLGYIYEEAGMYKSKEQKIGSFEFIDNIEFSRDGNTIAIKIENKGKFWFAFKNISNMIN